MKLTESIRISWRAIRSHKLRSTLTTLGIIIGIGAVIVFMVLGGAFEANILQDIDTEEDSTIQVTTQSDGGFAQQVVTSNIYTDRDAAAIEEIDGVQWVAPDARIPATQLSHGDRTVTGGPGGFGVFSVTASTPDQLDIDLFEMTEGEAFSSGTADEAVVNTELVELLDGDLAVGDELTVSVVGGEAVTVTVTGILDDEAGVGIPPRVILPLDPHYDVTVEAPDGSEQLAFSGIVLNAEEFGRVEEVRDAVDDYLQNESDARELKEEDHVIAVQTVQDAVDQFTDIIDQLAYLLGGIAAIALVVGSIGIANIMIVSVTERTREIGIMKAIGARRRDIVQLFLVESLVLGIIGAIVGVLVGFGVGLVLVWLLGWPMAYPLDCALVAVAVGIFVGVASGLYPAWRAATVDPIEALRRE